MGLFSKTKAAPPPESRVDINSLLGHFADRRCDAIYDRVQLRAGSWTPNLIRCFQTPVGQADPFTGHIRFYNDTNMFMGGMLGAPHDMIVRRFLFLFQPSCAKVDMNTWLARYQWDFRIMQKIFQREPMLVSAAVGKPEYLIENFGKGSWQDDKGDRANDSTSLIHKLGEGIAWDIGRGAEGENLTKYLPPLCQFEVALNTVEPFRLQSDIDFYVMLHGSRDYPVQ